MLAALSTAGAQEHDNVRVTPPSAPGRSRRTRLLADVVLVVLIAGLAAAVVLLANRNPGGLHEDAQVAAQHYALDLTTYDYQHIDQSFATVAAHTTGRFATQYRQVGQKLRTTITEAHAKSTGRVIASGVRSASGDRVVVLLFVDQTVRNTSSPKGVIEHNRMQMTLQKQDGQWLIAGVDLL